MIYLASDIHGNIRIKWLKQKIDEFKIDKEDILILLGDIGMTWDENDSLGILKFYKTLDCEVLFIDGNHENFDLLEKYPIINRYNGKVHKLSDNIFHLMRGEIYQIHNKNFFVFGGGFSLKKLTNDSIIPIWEREMPNEEEYENGLKNLLKVNNNVNYILTHVGPKEIVKSIGNNVHKEEQKLNIYFDYIKNNTSFEKWFFGHYHKDVIYDKYRCIFNDIVTIEEYNG